MGAVLPYQGGSSKPGAKDDLDEIVTRNRDHSQGLSGNNGHVLVGHSYQQATTSSRRAVDSFMV